MQVLDGLEGVAGTSRDAGLQWAGWEAVRKDIIG